MWGNYNKNMSIVCRVVGWSVSHDGLQRQVGTAVASRIRV